MAKSNLSILGLYASKPSIFDDMSLPEGLSKDDTVDNILLECAELEIVYSDADFLRAAIGIWSRKMLPSWEKLFKTTQLEYNPIWNKDGTITETEVRDLSENRKDTPGVTSTATEKVAAYDAETPQLATQNELEYAGENKSEGRSTGTITNIREEHGNIGITTTQQMIREEREIADFSIIAAITTAFKQQFCLLVY